MNEKSKPIIKGFEISGQEIPMFGSHRGQAPAAQQAADFSLFGTRLEPSPFPAEDKVSHGSSIFSGHVFILLSVSQAPGTFLVG